MTLIQQKAAAALKNMFVADSLAMPVHWFYNPGDIEKAFPGGIKRFVDAPALHPSSIMSLHSTNAGGRGAQQAGRRGREIVGDVILLYLAYKYAAAPEEALLANTNLGGDNVHRGMVLGALLGLINSAALDDWFHQLAQRTEIDQEINALLANPIIEI